MSDVEMTIREMCDAFDVTPRTLRFYEQKELLSPIREGQRRLFTRRDRGRLKLILRGKRIGLPLNDIRELLDLYDVTDGQRAQLRATLEKFRAHTSTLEAQRSDIESALANLREAIAFIEDKLSHLGNEGAQGDGIRAFEALARSRLDGDAD